jgi:hypothetical protein
MEKLLLFKYMKEKYNHCKEVLWLAYFMFTARNNLLSLWSRLVSPEQLSNSPIHLWGQHAGPDIDWQLRRDLCD